MLARVDVDERMLHFRGIDAAAPLKRNHQRAAWDHEAAKVLVEI